METPVFNKAGMVRLNRALKLADELNGDTAALESAFTETELLADLIEILEGLGLTAEAEQFNDLAGDAVELNAKWCAAIGDIEHLGATR